MKTSHHDESDDRPSIEDAFDPTTIPTSLQTVQPRTELGAQLLQLRRAIISAGIPLLSLQEIQAETDAQRRDR